MDDLQIIHPSETHAAIDGDSLVKARETAGLTQQQLADKVGVTRQFISKMEKPGKNEIFLETAQRIIDVLCGSM
jgi:DNA-binding XRE family transcriptional regulator